MLHLLQVSYGSPLGIRTRTGRILSPLSLPLDYGAICEVEDSDSHRGSNLLKLFFDCVLGTGRHPWVHFVSPVTTHLRALLPPAVDYRCTKTYTKIAHQSLTIANFFSSQPAFAYGIVWWVMTPTQPFVVVWIQTTPQPVTFRRLALHRRKLHYLCRIVKAGLILYPDLTYGHWRCSGQCLGVFTALVGRVTKERKEESPQLSRPCIYIIY